MIKAIIRIDTDQMVVIGEYYLGVVLGKDRIIEEGLNMLIIMEITLGKEILGKCKIMEVSIIEVDTEAIIEMTTLEEVEVGLEKNGIQVIFEGMIKAVVVVDHDHLWEPVLIEIELDVLNVGNMIILLKTVQSQETERQSEWIQQMYNLVENQTVLKVLVVDTYDNLIRINSDDALDHLNL